MDNKVIDLSANSISANIIQPSVSTKVSITEVTTEVAGMLSTAGVPTIQNVNTSTVITPLEAVVSGPATVLAKYDIGGLSVRLRGFGEESLSNYGALFVRPHALLNTTDTADYHASEYLKAVLLSIRAADFSSKVIGTSNNFLVSTKESVGLLVSSIRSIHEYLQSAETHLVGLTKPILDTGSPSEISYKVLGSLKIDTTKSIELVSKGYGKQSLSLADLQDSTQAVLLKSLLEAYDISDQPSIQYRTPKYDKVIQRDNLTLSSGISKQEAVVFSEAYVLLNRFVREYLDTYNTNDSQVFVSSKVLLAQAYSADAHKVRLDKLLNPEAVYSNDLKAVFLQKLLENSVYPSDDFYGAATLGDDQIASFIKVLPSQVYVGEVLTYLTRFNRGLYETIPSIDTATKSLSKVTNTTLSEGVQEQNAKVLDKALEEEFYFGERYTREKFSIGGGMPNDSIPTFEAALGKSDLFSSLTTLFKIYVSKSLQTKTTVEDQLGLLVEKSILINTSTSTDSTALATTKALLAATSNTTDVANLITNKQLKDGITISSDSILSISIHKYLKDIALSTDDFYGEANIDDDQYVSINKAFQDTVTTQDYFQSLYVPTTPLFATSSISDIFSQSTKKGVLDPIKGLTDQVGYHAEKLLLLEVASVDTSSKYFTKLLVDRADWFDYDYISEAYTLGGVVTDEQISVQIGTTLNTSRLKGMFTTAPIFGSIKGLQDYGVVSTSISMDLAYHLQDLLRVTDDFYGLANTDDDQYAQFIKRVVDTSTISDNTKYLTSKILLATVSALETVKSTIQKAASVDIGVLSEHNVKLAGKSINTVLRGVSDHIATQYTSIRILTDTPHIISGIPKVSLRKPALDSSTITDTSTVKLRKLALSNTTASEHHSSKVAAEVATSRYTEDYTYILAKSGPTMYVFPVDAYTSDITYVEHSKLILQAISVTEQKTANIQNYFPPLFAQVGYIGTNLTL